MKVSRFMAQQFSNPSGVFGRFVIGNLLNKTNIKSNEAVFELLRVSPYSNVLEIGFGGGDLLFKIVERANCESIHGLEISDAMLHRAETKASRMEKSDHIHLQLGTVDSLPYKDLQFDRVCSVNTIYFWPGLSKSIREIVRVTQTGGTLVLGFGSHVTLRESGYEEKGFILYTPEQIESALAENDLIVEEKRQLERKKRGSFHIFRSVKI